MLENLTIGDYISAAITTGIVYVILQDIDFVHEESVIGKIGTMISALFVWASMIYFAVKFLMPGIDKIVKRIIK